jgi:hypothetical protein
LKILITLRIEKGPEMKSLRRFQPGLFCFLVAGFLVSAQALCAQEKSPFGLIALLANPERFDGKQVTVIGYLALDHQKKHAATAVLLLHEEDAKNLLPNGVEVVPSEQMVRDEEKIKGMYVMMTGTARLVHTTNEIVIKDVRACKVWSDPRRPLTSSGDVQVPDKK